MIKVLSHLAHGGYQLNLSKVPWVEYYHIVNDKTLTKDWDWDLCDRPDNVFKITEEDAKKRIDEFDCMLIHAHPYIEYFKDWEIKKIFLEHTAPYPDGGYQQKKWGKIKYDHIDTTVYITHSSMSAWEGPGENSKRLVIYHAMDTQIGERHPELLNSQSEYRKNHTPFVMSTINAFIERNWCCGFDLWAQCVWPFEDVRVYGFGNENLGARSKGAVDHNTLMGWLSRAGVYFNPSTASPIPMSLLEAMAMGTPIVTTAYYEPGRIMVNGVHGIVSNNIIELREGIKELLADPDKANKMGENAREVVRETFTLEKFSKKWYGLFERISNKCE